MKKIIYLILLLSIIFIGCDEKEEWEIERDGMQAFFDKFTPSRWIYTSDKDSIVVEFGNRIDTFYYSSNRIYKYEWHNNGYIQKEYKYYPDGYLYDNNKIELKDKNGNRVAYSFNLDQDKLTLYRFSGNKDYVFEKENKITSKLDLDILSGAWSTTLSLDSIIRVFENHTMKEYVYEKNSGKILRFTEFDTYSLYRNTYTYGKKKRIEDKIWISDKGKIKEISAYILYGNKLILYKNEKPIIYTKILDN